MVDRSPIGMAPDGGGSKITIILVVFLLVNDSSLVEIDFCDVRVFFLCSLLITSKNVF